MGPKAITATAHKLARILYAVIRFGVAYQQQSEEAEIEQHRQRQEKTLRRKAKELGYVLRKIAAPPSEETSPLPASVTVARWMMGKRGR